MRPSNAEQLRRLTSRLMVSKASRALADIMAACGEPCGIEMSFRLRAGRVETGRFLLTQAREVLEVNEEFLWESLSALGLDSQRVRSATADAAFLHLGYEDGARPLCKVYAEYGATDATAWPLVHRAWKWRPDLPADAAEDEYRRIPTAAILGLLDELRGGKAGFPAGPLLDWCSLSLGRLGEPFALLVTDRASPRSGVDLRLYDLGARIGEIEQLLREVAVRLGIPDASMAPVLHEHHGDRLGHLAFGIGRDGCPFVTVYGGMALLRPEVRHAPAG